MDLTVIPNAGNPKQQKIEKEMGTTKCGKMVNK
jgi:hypothetical protein